MDDSLRQLLQQLPTTSAATAASEAAAAAAAATSTGQCQETAATSTTSTEKQKFSDPADLECESYNARIRSLRLELLDHMVGFLPKLREVSFFLIPKIQIKLRHFQIFDSDASS